MQAAIDSRDPAKFRERLRRLPVAFFNQRNEHQHMAANPPKRQIPEPPESLIRWLLDSDPSIRWQVMQDLIGALAAEVAAERVLNWYSTGE